MALPPMRRLFVGICTLAAAFAAADARAQGSKAENYSAGKSGPALFNSDCTGSGCHGGPQGLARRRTSKELADYLREHYTNSRESASLLASYLLSVPGAATARPVMRPPEDVSPRERAARQAPQPPPPDEKPQERSSSWFTLPELSLPSWLQPSAPSIAPQPPPEEPPPPRTRQGRRDETPPRRGPPPRELTQEPKPQESSTPSWLPSWPFFLTPNTEEAAKPPTQVEEKPAPRRRQSVRPPKPEQPPTEQAAKPPIETGSTPAPRARQTVRPSKPEQPPTEQAAKPPTETATTPPPRARQTARPSKPEPSATEQAANPPTETATTPPPRVRPAPPQRPQQEATRPSRDTLRRARQPDNVIRDPNNLSPDEVYRPARPGSESGQPMSADPGSTAGTAAARTPLRAPAAIMAIPLPEPSPPAPPAPARAPIFD